jgi:hypothetical protein
VARRRILVETDEDEAQPGFEPDRHQAGIGIVEVGDVPHADRADKATLVVVDPAVIGAADGFAVSVAVQELGPAMPA